MAAHLIEVVQGCISANVHGVLARPLVASARTLEQLEACERVLDDDAFAQCGPSFLRADGRVKLLV